MSNVRGFADLERGAPQGGLGGGGGGGRGGGGGGFGMFGLGGGGGGEVGGLPVAVPLLPSISEMLFQGAKKRSFIAVMTCVQVLMFLVTLIVGGARFSGAFVPSNPMAGPDTATLSFMGAVSYDKLRDGQVWRFLTPVLLHAGILHIGTNLFFQMNMGFLFENLWGTKRIAVIYWLAGLGGSIMSALCSSVNTVSVGASGALMGLLGSQMSFLGMNWDDVPNARQMMCTVVLILFLNVMLGLSNDKVDNWAHLGGFIAGVLVGAALVNNYTWRGNERTIQRVCSVLSVSLLVLGIVSIFTF